MWARSVASSEAGVVAETAACPLAVSGAPVCADGGTGGGGINSAADPPVGGTIAATDGVAAVVGVLMVVESRGIASLKS